MTIETAKIVNSPSAILTTTIDHTGWRRLHARAERRVAPGPGAGSGVSAATLIADNSRL